MKNQYIIGIILFSFFTSSCATIFKGSSAEVRVNSSPSGAEVFINDMDRGKTPLTLNLNRNDNYILHFKKDGYEDVRVEVRKKFDGATTIVGNLFSWWLLGIVVDVASGAAYSLSPADINGNMDELKEAGIINPDKIREGEIHVFMLTKEQWSKIGASK